jgi:hypothetical protein
MPTIHTQPYGQNPSLNAYEAAQEYDENLLQLRRDEATIHELEIQELIHDYNEVMQRGQSVHVAEFDYDHDYFLSCLHEQTEYKMLLDLCCEGKPQAAAQLPSYIHKKWDEYLRCLAELHFFGETVTLECFF